MPTPSTRRSPANAEGDVDLKVLRRFFPGERAGTCVEVGAARPDWLSIAATFRDRGWRVLAVEPNPTFAAMHRARGHQVAEYAATTDDRDDVPFFVVDSGGVEYRGGNVSYEAWSSLGLRDLHLFTLQAHQRQANIALREVRVRTRRLDTILSECCPDWTGVDLLTADIEGWELECLSGLDFERWRPKVLIIENQFCKASYRRFMRDRGYRLWRTLFPNDVYIESSLMRVSDFRYLPSTVVITGLRRLHLMWRKLAEKA